MEQSTRKCVLFTNTVDKSAILNYRYLSPAREAGISLSIGTSEKDFKLIVDSDLVFINREFPRNFSFFLTIRKFCQEYRKPLVIDMDDFMFDMGEDHPNRKDLSFSGLLVPLYNAIKTVDALVVSTARLAEACRPLTSNIFVFNNYLDDKIWEIKPPTSVKSEPVKILFMGSKSHQPDLQLIAEPLRNVLLAFPKQAEFTCYGLELPEQLKGLENAKQVNIFRSEYQDFVKDISSYEFDIGLGPLQTNAFNNSKSSIKYYEYTALGLASVMSDTEPYSQAIRHGIDGMLAKTGQDWETALTALVEDGVFRNELASQAQSKIRKTALLSNNFQRWPEIIDEIIQMPKKVTEDPDLLILEAALLEQDRLNKHYEKEVASNSRVIMANQTAISKLNEELDLQLAHRTTLEKEISNATQKWQETYDALNEQLAHRHVLEEEITRMNKKLSELNKDYDLITSEHNSLQNSYTDLSSRFESTHSELQSKINEVGALEQDVYWLKTEATAMASSTSWKITRPMRKVVRKLLKK